MNNEDPRIRPESDLPEPQPEAPLRMAVDDDDPRPYAVASEAAAPPTEAKPAPPRPLLAASWDAVWPLATRAKVLGLLLFLNVAFLPFSLLIFESASAIVSTLFLMSVLQAFLLGTFDRIDLARSAKGKVAMTRTWRVAFYPLEPGRIRWSEFESVTCGKSHESHVEDWVIAILLLLYGILPGILWYCFVIRPERVFVALCKQHGSVDTLVYRGTDETRAREVARTIADVTGLPYN